MNAIHFVVMSLLLIEIICIGVTSLRKKTEIKMQTKWVIQPLDRFNSSERRIWNMKYLENLELWKPNGTICILLGGEFPILATDGIEDEQGGHYGVFKKIAYETNGAMYYIEHRYYGGSKPLDTTTSNGNYKFLHSRQALADAAKLLKKIKLYKKFKNAKVIAVGLSYAGNLAVWLKKLYPNMIDAVAIGAPLLAKKIVEQAEAVANVYRKYGSNNCTLSIERIFKRYDQLFKSDSGVQLLKREENICQNIDLRNSENRQIYFLFKLLLFQTKVQFGTRKDIKAHCKQFKNVDKVPSLLHPEYDSYFHSYQYNGAQHYFDAWRYQQCTEFGWFLDTTSTGHPFTKYIDVKYFFETCRRNIGHNYTEDDMQHAVDKTNEFYDGLSPNVTKVVYMYGDMDPWRSLGPKDNGTDVVVIVIPGVSHVAPYLPITKTKSKKFKIAIVEAVSIVKKWIGVNYGFH